LQTRLILKPNYMNVKIPNVRLTDLGISIRGQVHRFDPVICTCCGKQADKSVKGMHPHCYAAEKAREKAAHRKQFPF
jgi:hypothetical protein